MSDEYLKYQSEKVAWIREQLEDPFADENTNGWEELAIEYDAAYYFDYKNYIDELSVEGRTPLEIFDQNIEVVLEILGSKMSSSRNERSKLVMLFGHIIGALEAYLSATFIENCLASNNRMRLLIETDPEFAKRKISMRDIFVKRENIDLEVKRYLKDLIFHNLAKVKLLYRNVFSVEFGELEWLYKAIGLRHDCIHRAGYDKNGNKANIELQAIEILIKKCNELVSSLEKQMFSAIQPKEISLEELFGSNIESK